MREERGSFWSHDGNSHFLQKGGCFIPKPSRFDIREWYFDQYLPIFTLILEMGHVSFCPDLPIFKLGQDRVWWVPMVVTEYTRIPHESPHSINGGQLSILSICIPSRNRKIGG